MTLGHLLAVIVVLLCVLGIVGVVPLTPVVVFGLILALAVAVLLGGFAFPWPPRAP